MHHSIGFHMADNISVTLYLRKKTACSLRNAIEEGSASMGDDEYQRLALITDELHVAIHCNSPHWKSDVWVKGEPALPKLNKSTVEVPVLYADGVNEVRDANDEPITMKTTIAISVEKWKP